MYRTGENRLYWLVAKKGYLTLHFKFNFLKNLTSRHYTAASVVVNHSVSYIIIGTATFYYYNISLYH